MSEERDPFLEGLFVEAEADLAGVEFANEVITRIQTRHRRIIGGRIAIAATIVALEVVLSFPMQNALGALAEALGTSLVQLENERLATVLAPLNSVAGLIGMGLLAMQFFYRRFIS